MLLVYNAMPVLVMHIWLSESVSWKLRHIAYHSPFMYMLFLKLQCDAI